MPHAPAPPTDRLDETADKLLATAERCYRLARGITDRGATDALLQLAEECEQRAEELRQRGGACNRPPHRTRCGFVASVHHHATNSRIGLELPAHRFVAPPGTSFYG